MKYTIDRGMVINAQREIERAVESDIGNYRSEYQKLTAIKLAKRDAPADFRIYRHLAALLSDRRHHHFTTNYPIVNSNDIISNAREHPDYRLAPA